MYRWKASVCYHNEWIACKIKEVSLSIFRTVIRLADWQSRSGQECALVYLKAVETDTDSLGNTAEITLGYSIVSR